MKRSSVFKDNNILFVLLSGGVFVTLVLLYYFWILVPRNKAQGYISHQKEFLNTIQILLVENRLNYINLAGLEKDFDSSFVPKKAELYEKVITTNTDLQLKINENNKLLEGRIGELSSELINILKLQLEHVEIASKISDIADNVYSYDPYEDLYIEVENSDYNIIEEKITRVKNGLKKTSTQMQEVTTSADMAVAVATINSSIYKTGESLNILLECEKTGNNCIDVFNEYIDQFYKLQSDFSELEKSIIKSDTALENLRQQTNIAQEIKVIVEKLEEY